MNKNEFVEYCKNKKINVIFLDLFNTKKYIYDNNEKIKVICDNYEKDSNFDPNIIIYKYEGIELDLNKTFADYDNSKIDFFIEVCPRDWVYVTFIYLGTLYSMKCCKEAQIEDICDDFASKNNISKKKYSLNIKII